MTPEQFVTGLVLGGGTNLSDFADDPDYCPVHAWDFTDFYHEDTCPAYDRKIDKRGQS